MATQESFRHDPEVHVLLATDAAGKGRFATLWNLVAEETREGDVYRKLLDKLERPARRAETPR